MFTEDKDTEIFCIADDFCKFNSNTIANVDNNHITYNISAIRIASNLRYLKDNNCEADFLKHLKHKNNHHVLF